MPQALIGPIIGAAASIGGGLLASSASKKATKAATTAATDATDKNNALQREVYQQNTQNLSPFMQRGNAAGNALSGMLLGPEAVPQQQSYQNGQYGAPQPVNALSGYSPANGMPPDYYPWNDPNMYGMTAEQAWAQQAPQQMPQPAFQPQTVGSAPAQAPANPWDQFRNSTNYQFRLDEGLKGLNQGYAARGMLQSGAAMKGINNYAQQFASNELGNYMNLLGQQQNVGLSGANALAGVGTNMANAISNQNNGAASAIANSALINGGNQGSIYSGVANSLGNFASSFGSSYAQNQPQFVPPPPMQQSYTGRWR